MGQGVYRVFAATMASADSVVSFFNTGGRAFSRVYLECPSFPSASTIDIYAGATSTAFYQVRKDPQVATPVTFSIDGTAVANGGTIPIPGGFQYYRLQVASAPTAAKSFNLICSDD